MTERRNPALVDAALDLHAAGEIEADTYVVDLDTVDANARALAETAAASDVGLWFVAKQYGRNPLVTAAVAAHVPAAAAIDVREVDGLVTAGARVGNVGHITQVPVRRLPGVLRHEPDFVTVFDRGNLEAVAAASEDVGRVQRVLLKIASDPAGVYPGQEGGFEVADVRGVLEHADALPGVDVVGVTGFPCLLLDPTIGRPVGTATLDRVLAAAEVLRDAGITPEISLPSHSSVSTIPVVAGLGGTWAEPGHALTGTTPEHVLRDDLREVPALVYVSEVAQLGGSTSVFGGGFYPRGRAESVLVACADGRRRGRLLDAPAENIDYYRRFTWTGDGPAARVGDPAVMAFRTQVFVTRSRVAVVSGVSSGRPVVRGLFDSQGRRLDGEPG
ncbi:MAG: alanine racemase [Nocardioidaceae bacterium]|nr:alanine racemase [Nocardioidaceae bacterium]